MSISYCEISNNKKGKTHAYIQNMCLFVAHIADRKKEEIEIQRRKERGREKTLLIALRSSPKQHLRSSAQAKSVWIYMYKQTRAHTHTHTIRN